MSGFDPTRPFEVVSGAAPAQNAGAFDPSQPFDVVADTPAPSAPSRLGVNLREGFRSTVVGEAVERTRAGQVATDTGAAAVVAANAAEAAGSPFGLEQVGGRPSPYAGIPVDRLREMGRRALSEGAARQEDYQTRVLPERRAEEAALGPWNQGNVLEQAAQGATALVGQVLGSMASPESFVGPAGQAGRMGRLAVRAGDGVVAEGVGRYVGRQAVESGVPNAVVGAAVDPVIQQGEIERGQREAYSPAETAFAAAIGGLIGTGLPVSIEGARGLYARFAARREAAGAPPPRPDGSDITPEERAEAEQWAREQEAARAAETPPAAPEAEAPRTAPEPEAAAFNPEQPFEVVSRAAPEPERADAPPAAPEAPAAEAPRATEPPPAEAPRMAPEAEAPRAVPEPEAETPPAPRPEPTPQAMAIEQQIARLTARGEPAPGTPAADQIARLRETVRQMEAPLAPRNVESAPPGRGSATEGIGRAAAGSEPALAAPARGAAQEGGAPPRGTDSLQRGDRVTWQDRAGSASEGRFTGWARSPSGGRVARIVADDGQVFLTGERFVRPVQQGASDAPIASAAPARSPEAPPSNVSPAPARAVPDGVTIYRDREEFSRVRRAGRKAEGVVERLTRNGEPPPGTAAARQLERARAAADAGRRAAYDPEAPEAPAPRAEPEAPAPRPAEPEAPAPRPAEPDAPVPRPEGGAAPLYANPLGDPAAWRRFIADPITGTAAVLKGKLTSSVAAVGTRPGPGAAWRLYADSTRATLLHFRERFKDVPGWQKLVDDMGATDPGSGRVVRAGFQQAAEERSRTLGNRLRNTLAPLGDDVEALGRVRDLLTGGTPRGMTSTEQVIARRLRNLLDEHHAWLTKMLGSAERELGYVRGKYFPRRYNAEKVQADLAGFTADAETLYRSAGLEPDIARLAADEWANRLLGVGTGSARYGDTPTSSFTKGRTLPPNADEVMRRWLVTDPREALAAYFENSTRHAEFVSRFGPNAEKFTAAVQAIQRAGATPTEAAIINRAFAAATGTAQGAGHPTTGLLSWAQMWGMNQLLTRAIFSSAVEPMSVGIRSGNLRDSFTALGNTWRRFLTPDSWRGSALKMETERAEMLGVLGDATREMMMAARVEGQNVTDAHARRINQMLTLTGQNRLFAASRIAASRIAEHTITRMVRDASDARAPRFLAEVGMDADTTALGRAWLDKHDGRPPVSEMIADTPEANAYRTAVNRFVNESVINPIAVDKPVGANERHPLAQLGYGIMSFQYAFTRNVLIRTFKQAGDAFGANMTAGERAALLVPIGGLIALSAAQMGMSNVRDAIFNRQAKQERPPFISMLLALDRAGMFGNLSPLVNLVTSAKYERDASGALAGPYVGTMLRQAGDLGPGLLPQSMGGPNSPNTNNAEWAAVRAAWGLIAAPTAVAVLAASPMPAWLKPVAGAGAMYVGSSDMSRTVATTVAGPRQAQARTPGSRQNDNPGARLLGR